MRVAIVGATLALAACATSPEATASLDQSLDAMVGQPITVALAHLGEPIGVAETETGTLYGWGRAFTSTQFLPLSASTIPPAETQGGVFPSPRASVQNDCVIRIAVGADGLIRNWDYQGNARGCRAYADSLAGDSLARSG